MEKVAICGCCVSRDTIAFADNKNIQSGCFIHFNSPLSLGCESILEDISIKQENLVNCTPFLQRCFYADWMKESYSLLKDSRTEWCLTDIGHIRYDVGEITRISDNAKTYITYSREATENIEKILIPLLNNDFLFKKKSIFELNDVELDNLLSVYCEKLINIFAPERIILQEVQCCELYKDEKGFINVFDQSFVRLNAFITKCHRIIKKKIPGCRVIPFPAYVLCDERHIWGKYCLHYQYEYYKYAYECLEKIILNNISNEQIVQLLNKYEELFANSFKSLILDSNKKQTVLDGIYHDMTQCFIKANTIERGGISGSSCYNVKKHELQIDGWYLPVDAYDTIIIEANGQYIGTAKLGIERLDVELNNRYYKNSKNSGFELVKILPTIEKIDQIIVTSIKSNVVVDKRIYQIKNI